MAKIKAATLAFREMSVAETIATGATKGLKIALATLGDTALLMLLGFAIQGLAKLADALIVTGSELADFRDNAVSTAEALENSYNQFTEEAKSIEELVGQYKEIAESADGITASKEDLLQIQTDLIDKYGDEAKGLDLVNGKYEEQIEILNELSETRRAEWETANADKITQAEKIAGYNVGWTQKNANGLYANEGDYDQFFLKGAIEHSDKLAASLYKVKGVSEDIEDIYRDIDGIDFIDGVFSNDLLLSGTVEEARDQLGELIDRYREAVKAGKASGEGLAKLTSHYQALNEVLESTNNYLSEYNKNNNVELVGEIFDAPTDSLKSLNQLNAALDGSREKWFENMSDMSKGVTETVDTITKALQTLAAGDGLSHDDFWGLKKLDEDNILTNIKQAGDSFVLSQEQLIALKDKYIQQQIDSIRAENEALKIKRDELQATVEQSEVELSVLGARGLVNAESRKAMADARESVAQGKKNLEQYGEQIRYNNILINEWNAKLGDTVDKTQLIKDLQEKADAAEKAMNAAIDDKLNALNNEKAVLESQKEILNEQLETLEAQKKEIEDIISDYETVGNIVKDEAERQIKVLEDEKKAQEDAVQAKIDALKESKEAQEKENTLIEKELELKQKLANLEKAKSTKVRTYSTERGYHFDVDKEAVMNAEEEVSKAQQAYDQAVAEDLYNKQLESLEKEKDMITENFDEQIKAVEEYSELWTEAINEQKTAEDELLAEQILGADWREKIKRRDIDTLNKYKANLKSYNTQLTNLVNNEITALNNSIKAKDNEIKAKEKQIQTWQNYKNEVQSAIDTIKGKYNDYVAGLEDVVGKENLSYENREQALRNFMETYEGLVDQIAMAQGRIQDVHAGIYIDTNVPQVSQEMANFIDSYRTAVEAMQKELDESLTGYGIVNSEWDARLAAAANALRRGYASGGVIDYTGVASVHGSKNSAETVFNASQSRELYNMVKSGEFSTQVANRAYEGIASVIRGMRASSNDNSSTTINLHQEFHGIQNAREFANQFNANIEQYWRTKLTESLVR